MIYKDRNYRWIIEVPIAVLIVVGVIVSAIYRYTCMNLTTTGPFSSVITLLLILASTQLSSHVKPTKEASLDLGPLVCT